MLSASNRRIPDAPRYNSLAITIGRNVGSEPMTDDEWELFHVRVTAAVDHYLTFSSREIKSGLGDWEGDEWGSVLTFLTDPEREFTQGTVENVKRLLRQVAADFQQQAIGVTYGRGELVYSACCDRPPGDLLAMASGDYR